MTSKRRKNRSHPTRPAARRRNAKSRNSSRRTVRKIIADANNHIQASGENGLRVEVMLAVQLTTALHSDLRLLANPIIFDMVRAEAQAMRAAVMECDEQGRKLLSQLCCHCEKELSPHGLSQAGIFIHFRPIGTLVEAWGNRVVVAIGCVECTNLNPELVVQAALDIQIKEPKDVRIILQYPTR